MGLVTATNTMVIAAPVDTVADAIADYAGVRPRILPEQYSAYRIVEGGQGAGTVAAWHLQATRTRGRDVQVSVTTAGSADTHREIVEADAHSSMVTTFVVRACTEGSLVEVTTSWTGAGGIGGFFEKTFAPRGLQRIQHELLENLRREVETD